MQYIIYSICLVTHITGIVLMAGASFIDYIIFRQFWKVWPADTIKAMTTENLMNRLQKYMGIGMLFILLSGAGMMIYLIKFFKTTQPNNPYAGKQALIFLQLNWKKRQFLSKLQLQYGWQKL